MGVRNADQSEDHPWHERADVGGRVRSHDDDEHIARYRWATARVGGRVLDIACGTGYGSLMLASAASEIIGLDRDAGALEAARRRVPSGTFVRDEVPPLPFCQGAFEAVVSFETVEHIEDDLAFVRELRRVLVPGGPLLISTPNRARTSPNLARPANPYHVREYLLPDLQALLRSAGFTDLRVWFQRDERRRVPEVVAGALIARIPRLCQPGRWWDRLGHGESDVLPWNPPIIRPLIWAIECR